MNSTKSIKIFLVILIYFSLFVNTVYLYSNLTKLETFTNFKIQIEKNPKSSGYLDLTGTPILIDGSATEVGAQNWSWFENQAWYGGGNGTLDDPYIIENIRIDGQGSGSCIEIRNSNVYFIIRNCTLYNSGSDVDQDGGIKLESVNYGKLINNNCSYNNANGIILSYSSYNNISGNIVNNNTNSGIRLRFGCAENAILGNDANFNQFGISIHDVIYKNIISGNIASNNSDDGIYLYFVYNTEIKDNFIDNNKDSGIYIQGSVQDARSCKVSGNNITNNNNYGIYLNRGRHHVIYNNNISYNNLGLYSRDNIDNNISSNIIDNNYKGIYLENSNNTNIVDNNINNNTAIGLHLVKSNDNDIFNNDLCGNNKNYRPVFKDTDSEGNNFKDNKCYNPSENESPSTAIIIIVVSIACAMFVAGMIIFRKIKPKNLLSSHKLKKEIRKTEAEVSLEKESHFCVVHRGKIVGTVYICPKCETYYCMKCATFLKKKGETCWSCNNKIEIK